MDRAPAPEPRKAKLRSCRGIGTIVVDVTREDGAALALDYGIVHLEGRL
jgi:hypothetical protein